MPEEKNVRFANSDFESLQKNYSRFLEDYTSSLGDMMAINSNFLKTKSEEIEKLLKINAVVFSERQESVHGTPNENGPEKKEADQSPPISLMTGSVQNSEAANEQFKQADAMLKRATVELENLNRQSNELMAKMNSSFSVNKDHQEGNTPCDISTENP